MKSLITLLITVFASVSFAGGSGGGGVVMTPFALKTNHLLTDGIGGGHVRPRPTPEILLHLGQKDGVLKFAYGQLKNNQWQIQTLEAPVNQLFLAPEEASALHLSAITNDWIYIK